MKFHLFNFHLQYPVSIYLWPWLSLPHYIPSHVTLPEIFKCSQVVAVELFWFCFCCSVIRADQIKAKKSTPYPPRVTHRGGDDLQIRLSQCDLTLFFFNFIENTIKSSRYLNSKCEKKTFCSKNKNLIGNTVIYEGKSICWQPVLKLRYFCYNMGWYLLLQRFLFNWGNYH